MKVLILSCNTGGGHNSCAQAIRQSFQNHDIACDIYDSLGFRSGRLSKFMTWGHSTMYRRIPGLFRFGYGFFERHPGILKDDAAVYKLLTVGAKELHQTLQNGYYDAVICTHVFSGLLLRETLLRFPMKLKTVFVATDYTCSPGAANSNLDLYFIPAESLREEFISQGVPAERIIVSGIPVRQDFYVCGDKELAKVRLGVAPEHTHLLMMCGSMGCGPIKKLTKQLSKKMGSDCELSVVCGTNKKLYAQLQKEYIDKANVHICGFTKEISTFLDSADLYLTKPGGLSSTEAMVKGLPMVLINAVAGCEEHNMSFFLQCGGAVTADKVEALADLCVKLAKNPKDLKIMAKALTSQLPGNASDAICRAVCELEVTQ